VRILIRGGMSPFDNFSATKEILEDTFGGNAGNMVYLYSVFRILMTDGCEIDLDYYRPERGQLGSKEIDEINEKYDLYIIPLADAFRDDFVPGIKRLTKFVEKLKIKVVVIGSGMKLPLGSTVEESHYYDNAVKSFVKAVLKKSAVFGVRGHNTEKYLKYLGFSGEEVRAIGCPSLYFHGAKLPLRDIPSDFSTKSKLIVTNSMLTSTEIHEFMRKITDTFENFVFVPQLRRELNELYYGMPYRQKGLPYPINISDEIFTSGRARFFLNVPTWLEHNSKADLSVGPRLHGNIASMLGGTPALIVMKDGRMQELVEFHNLTHISMNDITPQTDLIDLVHKLDFHSIEKVHASNFENFVSFLKANGVSSIYDNADEAKDTPFDKTIEGITFNEPIIPFSACDMEELIKRCNEFFPAQEKYINGLHRDSAYKRAYERFMPGFIADEEGWGHKMIMKHAGYKK
jgi:hypothetical protein